MPVLRKSKPSYDFMINKVLALEERIRSLELRFKELELRDEELQEDIDAVELRVTAIRPPLAAVPLRTKPAA